MRAAGRYHPKMESLAPWSNFNVAMVGATATLAGLVIVAASVNIKQIVHETLITSRLAAAISALMLAFASSATALMPGMTLTFYGVIIVVLTLVSAAFAADATWRIFSNRDPHNTGRVGKAVTAVLVPVAYGVSGVLLLAGAPHGLFWVAAGSIASIATALLVSWIVLVEVLR